MHPKQYITSLLLVACLLAADLHHCIAQRTVGGPASLSYSRIAGESLFFNHAFPYKNGVLFLKNNYAREVKEANGLLPGENRPNGFYVFDLSGKRTAICFTLRPLPDTVTFGPLYGKFSKISMNLPGLRIRITRNGKIEQDWRPVSRSTPAVDTFIQYYPRKRDHEIFTLSDDTLEVNDVLVVDGKFNTDTAILFTYYIHRLPKTIHPRLFVYSHEWKGTESRIDQEMINRSVLKKDATLKWIDKHYEDWLKGTEMHNFRVGPASRFIFYFGKADSTFADSTMEYRLLGGKYRDTSWVKTGHMILVDGLTGNQRYSMEVRYSSYPENIELYTFNTEPHWYQTNWFKGTIAAASFLLLLALVFFGYRGRLNREKEKKALLSARLQAMQAQLNPHFIFNALSSIQALMNKQENDKAHQYLSTFGSLLRNVLTNSNHDHTTLDQEIRSLEAYLQLEQLRSGFQYSLEVAADIQTATVTLPVMLLQPLIENAIRHGIAGMEEQGRVRISFAKEKADLLATIEDNGKGFDTAAPSNGYGLKLVEEKIQLINALQEQQAIQMSIRSTGAGTTVLLTFKNWLV